MEPIDLSHPLKRHAAVRVRTALTGTRLTDSPIEIAHYLHKDKVEVGFVLERSQGEIVGIEVKASATAKSEDFRGLTRVRDSLGRKLKLGILLHDGEPVLPFGDRLIAAPIALLWRA
ncbi:MAG: hypothetical protein ACE5FO_13920 [Parvularculaceae bacterium]